MPHRQCHARKKVCARRKKVKRKNGKRYYKPGPKSAWRLLKGNQKPPRVKR